MRGVIMICPAPVVHVLKAGPKLAINGGNWER